MLYMLLEVAEVGMGRVELEDLLQVEEVVLMDMLLLERLIVV